MKQGTFRKILCMFLLLIVSVGAFSLSAYAEGDTADYYLSYKKYSAAENPDGTGVPVLCPYRIKKLPH